MYDSSADQEYHQGDFELLPHERISQVWAEDFQRYFDRWIKFWPKNRKTGYFQKLAYDQPFYQPKSKKNPDQPRHLWEDYLVEQVERHLDGFQWREWKQAQQHLPVKESQFWLGLTMPKKTTVSCIDLDAKQFLLGYCRPWERSPLCPVVYLPLDHFQKLKRVYDHFPGRVWCISSATLGLHAWIKYASPVDTLRIHNSTKNRLAEIGLGSVEVHPMPGRCLRRPFGEDYVTITREGMLTTWLSQTDFFEFIAETPPFELLAKTLLAKVKEQWAGWLANGEAKGKKVNPQRVLAEHQHHVDEVERWIEEGCPVPTPATRGSTAQDEQLARWIDEGCPARTPRILPPDQERAALLHRWIDGGCPSQDGVSPSPISVPQVDKEPAKAGHFRTTPHAPKATEAEAAPSHFTFDLDALRNGNWAKGLREIALSGLPCPRSLHPVCYELAKWLFWIELYREPYCEEVIFSLLLAFVRMKHNGQCQRVNNDEWASVEADLKNAINSAKKLDPAHRQESLELFARLRQKRRQGQYKHVINLTPLLAGGELPSSSSLPSSGLLICVSSLEADLPEELQQRIRERAGRNKVMAFATRLVNLLHEKGGSSRLHRDKHLAQLLGYNNPSQVKKYVDILVAANILKKGNYYRQRQASKLYTLSKDVIALLNESKATNCAVA